MPIFYFRFEARPKNTGPESANVGGALINCWIQRNTLKEAESYARGSIPNDVWVITQLEDAFAITRETQAPEGMHYFEQAEIDQEVFVFHRWPVGAQDDGTSTRTPKGKYEG
jgi:hypothetical protein